ncbi:MAG: hypothetical protein PV344_06465, partial [Anaplasma sp.]|nr:hypothetical protein [Anaplasma sp.]
VAILREQLRMRGSGLASFPFRFGSPPRGGEAKSRGNENRDITRLVGLLQSPPYFPKIQPSVQDTAF